jgi:hypothetical protein
MKFLALSIVLAHLVVALTPCFGSATDAAPDAHAGSHSMGGHAQHAAVSEHHGAGHEQHEPPSLRAPCQCGCADATTAPASSARIGFALLPARVPLPPSADLAEIVPIGPQSPAAPLHSVDHVPILS